MWRFGSILEAPELDVLDGEVTSAEPRQNFEAGTRGRRTVNVVP
jgi:hypothetical protein